MAGAIRGEQQRAQLARFLAAGGKHVTGQGALGLLLDEPAVSLNMGHQLIITQLAMDDAARGGRVVAVKHELDLTAIFADRRCLISAGHPRDNGAPRAGIVGSTCQHRTGVPCA
ncbi:MAG: hypothetical protein AAGF27_00100 [Pseudomonadota bacterium]